MTTCYTGDESHLTADHNSSSGNTTKQTAATEADVSCNIMDWRGKCYTCKHVLNVYRSTWLNVEQLIMIDE